MFHKVIAHGMLGAGLIFERTGHEAARTRHDLSRLRTCVSFIPFGIGDSITATLTVTEKHPEKGDLVLDCRCTNQNGELVISGTSQVRAPTEKVCRPRIELPDVQLSRHERFRALLAATAGLEPIPTAVAYPCDANALGAAVEAAHAGLIVPILVGPTAKIIAAAAKVDISGLRLVDVRHSDAAATEAVALVERGEAALLMKGSLHTDELLHAVLAAGQRSTHGASAQPRLSHGCAGLSASAARDRCGGEYRTGSRAEARHRAKRDRFGSCHGNRDAARGAAVGCRDRQPEDALDHRRRGTLQDGRPWPDHGRPCWMVRSRSTTR